MKLHRISVANLNSVVELEPGAAEPQPQVVDLDEDLGGAPLFLIMGPTGSGKSTLMDAVSLALFGTTSRAEGVSGGATGRAELLMSQGTGRCLAEVVVSRIEPETGRRIRFRARWSARRAREQADGTIRAPQRSLERLEDDGSWTLLVSDERASVFKPVFDEHLLGDFTLEDFQRSMLLAQGQFDALLRAPPKERARILERLTHTHEYQQLGRRAAELRRAWSGRLDRLQERVDAFGPVSAEDRTKQEQQVERAAGRAAALQDWLARVEAAQAWRAEHDRRQAELDEAREHRMAVAERAAEQQPRIDALAEHDRCAEAFERQDRVASVTRTLEQTRDRHTELAGALPGLLGERERTAGIADLAGARRKARSEALEALREPIDRARQARREQERAAAEQAKAGLRLEQARRGVATRASEQADAADALTRAEAALSKADADLEAGAPDRAVHEQLEPLATRLATLKEQGRRLGAAAERHAAVAADLAVRTEQLDATAAELGRRKNTLIEPLRDAVVRTRRALELLLPPQLTATQALSQARSALDSHRTQLDKLADAQRGLAALRTASAAHDDRLRAFERTAEQLDRAARDVAPAEQSLDLARQGLGRAGAVLDAAKAMAALSTERDALQSGQPCPLCGSTEHPLADQPRRGEDLVAAELARQQQAHDEARQAETDALTRLSGFQAALARSSEAHRAAQAELATALQLRDRQAAAWAQSAARAALLPEADEAVLDQACHACEAERARLETHIDAIESAHRAHDEAERTLAGADEALDDDMAAHASARAEHAAASGALEQARADHAVELRDHEARRNVLVTDLAALGISGEDPAAWRAAIQVASQRWQALVGTRATADSALERARSLQAASSELLAQAEAAEQEAASELAQRSAAAAALSAARHAADELLQSAWQAHAEAHQAWNPQSTPDALLAEAQEAARLSAQRAEDASLGATAAARAHDEARASLAAWAQGIEQQERELHDARLGLQAILIDLHLADGVELDRRRLGPAGLAEARSLRSDLEQASAAAEQAVRIAQTRGQTHAAARPSDLPEDVVADQISERREALVSALRNAVDEADRARQDLGILMDRAAGREQAAGQLRQAHRQADVWLRLHELIGRSDGEVFQKFAQALNLDSLLRAANVHLQRLSPRYQLVPRRDESGLPTLQFDVHDTHGPGRARSLRTLSGGESFLVSLALALGLADLRTSTMPVETLLLDEGFGTLDPETLQVALDALQQVQADGRQVGVISHVVGLHEAIPARVIVEPLGEGRSRVRTEVG